MLQIDTSVGAQESSSVWSKDYGVPTTSRSKTSAHYIGAGDLVNGHWWPLQICVTRDGAYGDISWKRVVGRLLSTRMSTGISSWSKAVFRGFDRGGALSFQKSERHCSSSNPASLPTLTNSTWDQIFLLLASLGNPLLYEGP